MRRHRQLPLGLRTWGGKRDGAGRKPKGDRPGVTHLKRPALARRHPAHVTLRVGAAVGYLRSGLRAGAIEQALRESRKPAFHVAHYSIQGNHLHLLAEAESEEALARGIQGLEVRIARKLNRLANRRGKVFADRYHVHVLGTPREVKHAVRYVLGNFAIHAGRRGEHVRANFSDPCCSARFLGAPIPEDAPVTPPRTWLLRVGWCGTNSPHAVSG